MILIAFGSLYLLSLWLNEFIYQYLLRYYFILNKEILTIFLTCRWPTAYLNLLLVFGIS